jgi:hypothetical protein
MKLIDTPAVIEWSEMPASLPWGQKIIPIEREKRFETVLAAAQFWETLRQGGAQIRTVDGIILYPDDIKAILRGPQ